MTRPSDAAPFHPLTVDTAPENPKPVLRKNRKSFGFPRPSRRWSVIASACRESRNECPYRSAFHNVESGDMSPTTIGPAFASWR